MPTIEEMKDYALSYDEGSCRPTEQSFLTPLQFNQRLIPGLLCLTLLFWVGTPMQVASGMIVLTIIFVYINAASYQAAKVFLNSCLSAKRSSPWN